jgi:hypothetical protein
MTNNISINYLEKDYDKIMDILDSLRHSMRSQKRYKNILESETESLGHVEDELKKAATSKFSLIQSDWSSISRLREYEKYEEHLAHIAENCYKNKLGLLEAQLEAACDTVMTIMPKLIQHKDVFTMSDDLLYTQEGRLACEAFHTFIDALIDLQDRSDWIYVTDMDEYTPLANHIIYLINHIPTNDKSIGARFEVIWKKHFMRARFIQYTIREILELLLRIEGACEEAVQARK